MHSFDVEQLNLFGVFIDIPRVVSGAFVTDRAFFEIPIHLADVKSTWLQDAVVLSYCPVTWNLTIMFSKPHPQAHTTIGQ